ncbi:hypothetical protein BGX31_004443 [Mortierella sp. GBA43]|nr:hypothetical protein BGX31_004443 [Mortierella sp. GBA43]
MMRAAIDPESIAQNSIDMHSMNYESIISLGFPFSATQRVDVNQENVNLWNEVEATCVQNGTPVILEGYHKHPKWNHTLFTMPYIEANHGENGKDLRAAEDVKLTMKDYVRTVHASSLDGSALEHRPKTKYSKSQQSKLLYAKDVTCPPDWRTFLMDTLLPPFLSYMGNNDLNNLNRRLAAENLMVYIGQEGTWTPAHIDQCGAIGHNIMAWADDDSSSIWFMIKAADKEKAEELWKKLGHPLEYESYFASLEDLKQADFPIYVVEQKIGDLVMVPSLSYHQVVNLGKATVKVSWNRLTPHCLDAAVNRVLPRYREIARPEGYRIKTIIKSTVEAWKDLLVREPLDFPYSKEYFCQSFKTIMNLFRTIVEEDWVDLDVMRLEGTTFTKPRRLVGEIMPAVCDFCNTDLWNRHYRCLDCKQDGDEYDVCTRCFSLGRGCMHRGSSIEFVENFSMKSCQRLYSEAIEAWNNSKAFSDCPKHEQLPNPWADNIVPKPGDYSFTTLAYKRQELLKDPSFVCHICQPSATNTMRIDCPKCTTQYCESCLYTYHKVQWTHFAKRKVWECPRCTGTCHCPACDEQSSSNLKPLIDHSNSPPLMFSRPDEDSRNRGGVADMMNQSFDSSCEEDIGDTGDETWDESKMEVDEVPNRKAPKRTARLPTPSQNTRGSRVRKRTFKVYDSQQEEDNHNSRGIKAGPDPPYSPRRSPAGRAPSSDEQPREVKRRKRNGAIPDPATRIQIAALSPPSTVPTPLSSASSLSPPSSSSSSGSSMQGIARPSLQQVTAEGFRTIMNIDEEQALRYAREHGLWRTIKTFQEEQTLPEELMMIFKMDAFWAARSQTIRASFQKDIVEKYGPVLSLEKQQS